MSGERSDFAGTRSSSTSAMQQDGPNSTSKRTNKGKNERYTAAAHPKMLSLSEAKRKAAKFAAKNDKSLRVGAKRAILRELNSHLVVKAQGIFPSAQNTGNPYATGQPVNPQIRARTHKEVGSQQVKSKEYTWNRNGRQDELKIRCIARKFLFLWIKNVYGRLHPFVARSHYQQQLKLKVIRTWQEIWWSGRKGWKLNIRAEYHNRYRTWVKVWRNWRAYVMIQRVKNEKLQRAIQHYNGAAQALCISAWKRYLNDRKLKKRKKEHALEIANYSLKRWVWLKWMKEIEKRKMQTEMEHAALKYWAVNLIAKSWTCWMSVWDESRLHKKKMSFAKQKADKSLITKVWICWKNFITVKKLKNIQKRIAVRHCNISLISKALTLWTMRWQRNQQIAEFVDLIEYKGDMSRKRRVLIHWKFYVMLQQHQQLGKEKAHNHYLRTLKRTCFHALMHYKQVQNQKWVRKRESQEFWHKLQLRRVWKIWLKSCEHSEELKIYPLTRKARTLYRVSLLQKAFIKWQNYRRWRKYRKMQYSIAGFHYSKIILPRYFNRIKMFVDIVKERREMQYEADHFRRDVLLSQGFYKWYRESQLAIDVKMMTRMAILHHDDTIKLHFLKVWRLRTRQELHQHSLEIKAQNHYEQFLLIKAITGWKNFAREMTISRYYYQTAVRHYYLNLLRNIWSAWSKYIEQREAKWRKQAIADIHYQHKSLRNCLECWKAYRNVNQAAMSTANERFRDHELARMRWAMSSWHHFVFWHKNKCILNHRAKTAYRNTIVKKAFTSWHVYTCQRALKTQEQAATCKEKRAVLDQAKLHRAFRTWIKLTKSSQHKKSLHQISEQHHRKKLLIKALTAWGQFVKQNFKIKLLDRQSHWLHNHRITKCFFRSWKRQYSISIETRKRTSLSLWHWSVTLQRKAFEAWLQYAVSKKQKEIRIAQALDQRRARLIRTGVTHWIEVAFHLSSIRNRYAQARHVQQAHNIHQVVYKCALHWRRWTAKRLANKIPQRLKPAHEDHSIQSTSYQRPTAKKATTIQIPPDLFKPRPRPRVPDYLRESYDISSIGIEISPMNCGVLPIVSIDDKVPNIDRQSPMNDDKAPINDDKAPMSSRTFSVMKQTDETPCPRPVPPQPCSQVLPHPRQRSFTDDSMTLSTDGEWGGGALVQSEQRVTNVKLLPPSSFQVPFKGSKHKEKQIIQDNDHEASRGRDDDKDIKTEIFEARKKLQEYYNLKLRYRAVKHSRDALVQTIENGNISQDYKEQLAELEAELGELTGKIEQDNSTVELVAANIQQLIEKVSQSKMYNQAPL